MVLTAMSESLHFLFSLIVLGRHGTLLISSTEILQWVGNAMAEAYQKILLCIMLCATSERVTVDLLGKWITGCC